MKHQKVSVDVWAMMQSMVGYLAVVLCGGVLLRLLVTVVTLPSRLKKQRKDVQQAMLKLQEKYPEAFDLAESSGEKGESEKGQEGGKEEEKEDKGREREGELLPIEQKKTK